MKKLVSIVMPVFNAENTVKRSIESICKQTYKNWELIIINDGSEDNSLNICRLYEEHNNSIKVLTIKNSGPAFARQKGIDESKGEYIAFCDADDFMEADMIEKLVYRVECGNELVVCQYKIGDNDSRLFLPEHLNREEAIIRTITDNDIGGYLWNKIFLRSIINENNLSFDFKIYYCEDMLFVVQYILCCKNICLIPDKLYNYEGHPNSLSNGNISWKKLTNVLAREKIQMLLEEFHMKRCIDSVSKAIVQQAVYAGRSIEKNKINDNEWKSYRGEVWSAIKRICKKYKAYVLKRNDIPIKTKINILRYAYLKKI